MTRALAGAALGALALLGACGTKKTSDGHGLPDHDAAAPGLAALRIELPAAPAPGRPFPVLVRTADGIPIEARIELAVGDGPPLAVALRRGRGSAGPIVAAAGPLRVRARLGAAWAERTVTVQERPVRRLAGTLDGDDLRWDASADVRLEGTVAVPAGRRLVIEAGARVLGGARANLDVAGELEARGTAEAPVLFTRAGDEPWGGIRLAPGARGRLAHVLLTEGGGDPARPFGHSESQPLVLAEEGARLEVEGGGAVDNPGKAYSSARATVTIRGVLVSRCDQGGEHEDSELLLEGSHILEIPDADGRFDDDDNDGLYLSSGRQLVVGTRKAIVRDTVIAVTEDDGIDHAGVPVDIERVWIEGVPHEGIAASNGARVTVTDSVIKGCGQGIEAGWGAPEVVVTHSLLLDNGVGLRWGDEYEWKNEGRLTARYVVVIGSRQAAVRNLWEGGGGVSDPSRMEVSCSILEGAPALAPGGCLAPGAAPLPGCPDGPPGPRTCR